VLIRPHCLWSGWDALSSPNDGAGELGTCLHCCPLNEIESFSCKINEYPNEGNHTRLSVRWLSDQLRKISIVAKGSMNAKPILAKTSSKLGVIALLPSDP
jgi:hypothetical protein